MEAILILHQKGESVRSVDLAGYMGYSKPSVSHAVRNLRTLYHEKRRHWDDWEFDEYIVAAEGLLSYQPTPEDLVCQQETLALLLSILDTCTAIQRDRFLLYHSDLQLVEGASRS